MSCAVARLLPTRGGRLALLALLAVPVLLVHGVRPVDGDVAVQLGALARGAPLHADRIFLLEGLLPDALGAGLARLGLPAGLMPHAWWSLGLAGFAAAVACSLLGNELSFRDLLLLVAFTHLVDTLALWVGKFDPLLLALLTLSAWRRPVPAVAGSALAAFCHPLLATLSTVGVAAVDVALGRGVRQVQVAAVAAAAAVDLAAVHALLPGFVGRDRYMADLVWGLLHDAALLGPVTLVSGALVPFALVRRFAGPFRFGTAAGATLMGLWAGSALFVACVMTLDHTRVLFLLTFAPAVAFLRGQGAAPDRAAHGMARWDWSLFALLFLCRLALPHIDGNGAVSATPYPLAPWVEPAPRQPVVIIPRL